MKVCKILIIVLTLVICAETFLLFFQTSKLRCYKMYDEMMQKGADVYIIGLSTKIKDLHNYIGKSQWQERWLKRHLDNCLLLIEQQANLEPLPYEHPDTGMPISPKIKTKFQEMHLPFFEPYLERELSEPEIDYRHDKVYAVMSLLDMQLHNFHWQKEHAKSRITHFEKRLSRISKHYNVDNSEEPNNN